MCCHPKLVITLLFCIASGCQRQDDVKPEDTATPAVKTPPIQKTPAEVEGDDDDDLKRLKTLYDKAKSTGKTKADTTKQWLAEAYEDAKSNGGSTADETQKLIDRLYRQAKQSGETTAGSAKDWVVDDFRKLGSWQYKTVRISTTDPTQIEAELNKLGAERWDCFWVDKDDSTITFYLKRTRRSVLRQLPARELLRLLPLLGGGDSGPTE